MKITLIQVGKTHFKFVETGFEEFRHRLKHYTKFDLVQLELTSKQKTNDITQIKKTEGELILKKIHPNDYVILLDENGISMNSVQFAAHIEKLMPQQSSLVFVIGGAYGFSEPVYERSNGLLSLSSMTFSHQLIRLIFIEQLYRAFTIIKGEPYHHQ